MRIASHPPIRPRLSELLYGEREDRQEVAKSNYHRDLAMQGVSRAVIGGVAGMAFGQGNPLYIAAGAGIGAYTAWESTHRQQTGTASITLDGKTYQRTFYGKPDQLTFTPEERKVMDTAVDHPTRIAACAPKIAEPSAEQMAPWNKCAQTFKQLGSERRLVADLGQECDGQPVVHLVDGIGAAKLAAAGKAVYVVQGQPAVDQQHSLSVSAFNRSRSEAFSDNHSYLERSVDYKLVRLGSPADLQDLPAATGVPEGFLGVLRDAQHYGEVLNRDTDNQRSSIDSPEFGTRGISSSESSFSLSNRRVQGQDGERGGLRTTHHLNFPAYGAILGMAAGMFGGLAYAGPGVPGPVMLGAAVGFLAGRAGGRWVTDHTPGF